MAHMPDMPNSLIWAQFASAAIAAVVGRGPASDDVQAGTAARVADALLVQYQRRFAPPVAQGAGHYPVQDSGYGATAVDYSGREYTLDGDGVYRRSPLSQRMAELRNPPASEDAGKPWPATEEPPLPEGHGMTNEELVACGCKDCLAVHAARIVEAQEPKGPVPILSSSKRYISKAAFLARAQQLGITGITADAVWNEKPDPQEAWNTLDMIANLPQEGGFDDA